MFDNYFVFSFNFRARDGGRYEGDYMKQKLEIQLEIVFNFWFLVFILCHSIQIFFHLSFTILPSPFFRSSFHSHTCPLSIAQNGK